MSHTSLASWIGRAARQVRHRVEASIFDVLSAVVRLASPRVRLALGSALGTLVWALDVRHRRVARENVRLAYGTSLAPRESRRLVLGSVRHFTRLALETLAFPRYLADAARSQIRVEGLEHGAAAIAKGRGVIGFSGHFGHWELLIFTMAQRLRPASVVARPLDNPHLEKRLSRLRTLSGNRVVAKRGAVSDALSVLEGGGIVTLLIDQRPKRGGIPVPFFGHPAYTTELVATLALRTGASIVPAFAFLERDGAWRIVLEPEVPVVRTGNLRTDAYRITADCTAVLERWIRRYPEQWLWMHGRWRAPRTGPRT